MNHVIERLLFHPMVLHGTPVFSISFWFTYIYIIFLLIIVFLSMSMLNCLLFVLIIKWARYLHTITICIRIMCCISYHCSTQCNTFVEIMIHGFIRLRYSIKLHDRWRWYPEAYQERIVSKFKFKFSGLLTTRLKARTFLMTRAIFRWNRFPLMPGMAVKSALYFPQMILDTWRWITLTPLFHGM